MFKLFLEWNRSENEIIYNSWNFLEVYKNKLQQIPNDVMNSDRNNLLTLIFEDNFYLRLWAILCFNCIEKISLSDIKEILISKQYY